VNIDSMKTDWIKQGVYVYVSIFIFAFVFKAI